MGQKDIIFVALLFKKWHAERGGTIFEEIEIVPIWSSKGD
jgi:hypothetical protein